TLEAWGPEVVLQRIAPAGPPPALVDARRNAESLRHRVAEERVELQGRVETLRARVEELERTWSSAGDPAERERMALEVGRLRARRDLAIQHAELAEQHVLSGDDLTVAYGKMEQAAEHEKAGDMEAATAAFAEARGRLEAALTRLDVVEEAVGARSEAEAGLEAWRALAASAALEELPAATQGAEILAGARERLAGGDFEQAIQDLRRASQQFATALAEGRKVAAASRAAEPEPGGTADATPAAEPVASTPEPDAETGPAATASRDTARAVPPVSAPPPSRARAAIKLVEVPAGEFLYGSPARRMALGAFRIDRTEVRVNEYRACVDAGACSEPAATSGCNWSEPERGDHPVNCVSWDQARAYCGWVGKRLPYEREWEKAARGTDGRLYPWGDDAASCTRAVIAGEGAPGCGRDSTSPVGSRATGRSPFGLFDMTGNVLEWTADLGEGSRRVVRGGSWQSEAGPISSSRDTYEAGVRDPGIGFRCAQSGGLYASTP
ncbi:MAG: SUMF1/EgtB/PvdO family nonheme iron enzyme, partial [Myxococcota bacterium]